MLESVVTAEGTGKLAAIPGYRVSGKTGTAFKAIAGGYSTDRYMAVFGGVAPATAPRLAAVVVIDEPSAGQHMGGQVSAPVFSRVVGGALRLLAVAPDQPVNAPEQLPAGPALGNVRTASSAMMRRYAAYRAAPRPLAELVAGWVTVPAELTVSDLTLDSRAATPGALFLACRGRTHHGLAFAREAVARGARAVLYEPDDATSARRSCGDAVFVAPLARARRPCRTHRRPFLRRAFAAADRGRHYRDQRQDHLCVAARAGTATLPAPVRLSSAHSAVGIPPRVKPMPHTTPGCDHGAPPARSARGGRRPMRQHGGLLARPRSGARERCALPHGSLHQSHPRSPRLSRHHGALRRSEGAPVRMAGLELSHHQRR